MNRGGGSSGFYHMDVFKMLRHHDSIWDDLVLMVVSRTAFPMKKRKSDLRMENDKKYVWEMSCYLHGHPVLYWWVFQLSMLHNKALQSLVV